MPQGKWFNHNSDLRFGDIVLFTKTDSYISKNYTYGMVNDVKKGDDGHVRKVTLPYQNHNKSETCRSVRYLILIHPVDNHREDDLIENVK